MKKCLIAFVFYSLSIVAVLAQAIGGNNSLSVTTTTANVALPASAAYPAVLIVPAPGSTGEVFYNFGTTNAVTATVSSPSLPNGGICFASQGPKTYLAAITSSGAATLRITQLTQCPQGFNFVAGTSGGVVVVTPMPSKGAGAYSSATVGTSDSTILAASSASYMLDLVNNSATATVCINFGATATISGTLCAAGEYTLPPLWHRSWENNFIPTDAIHAIASAASTPLTVGAK